MFANADFISKEQFWSLLQAHVPTLPDTPPECLAGLRELEGRPIFFFDWLLAPAVRRALRSQDLELVSSDVAGTHCETARRMVTALLLALPDARRAGIERILRQILHFVNRNDSFLGIAGISIAEENPNLKSMLSSVFLDGRQLQPIRKRVKGRKGGPSKLVVDVEAMRDGVKRGVFVWDPERDPNNVLQEPLVIQAVEQVGLNEVLDKEASNDVMLHSWATDVVDDAGMKGKLLE